MSFGVTTTFKWKDIQQYYVALPLSKLYKVVQKLESVDEILHYAQLNQTIE